MPQLYNSELSCFWLKKPQNQGLQDPLAHKYKFEITTKFETWNWNFKDVFCICLGWNMIISQYNIELSWFLLKKNWKKDHLHDLMALQKRCQTWKTYFFFMPTLCCQHAFLSCFEDKQGILRILTLGQQNILFRLESKITKCFCAELESRPKIWKMQSTYFFLVFEVKQGILPVITLRWQNILFNLENKAK
jgi:hypothetical protein